MNQSCFIPSHVFVQVSCTPVWSQSMPLPLPDFKVIWYLVNCLKCEMTDNKHPGEWIAVVCVEPIRTKPFLWGDKKVLSK